MAKLSEKKYDSEMKKIAKDRAALKRRDSKKRAALDRRAGALTDSLTYGKTFKTQAQKDEHVTKKLFYGSKRVSPKDVKIDKSKKGKK